MPLSLTLASLGVIAAAGVALLPTRSSSAPSLLLLMLAAPLAVLVGRELGRVWVGLVILAVVSIYRRPFGALARHLLRLGKGAA